MITGFFFNRKSKNVSLFSALSRTITSSLSSSISSLWEGTSSWRSLERWWRLWVTISFYLYLQSHHAIYIPHNNFQIKTHLKSTFYSARGIMYGNYSRIKCWKEEMRNTIHVHHHPMNTWTSSYEHPRAVDIADSCIHGTWWGDLQDYLLSFCWGLEIRRKQQQGILPIQRSQLARDCLVWGIHPVCGLATVGQVQNKGLYRLWPGPPSFCILT